MTHLSVPPEERAVLGITDTLVILLVNTLIVNKTAVVNKTVPVNKPVIVNKLLFNQCILCLNNNKH